MRGMDSYGILAAWSSSFLIRFLAQQEIVRWYASQKLGIIL